MWFGISTICVAQLIAGLTFSSQGVPRMTFLFPQLMILMWNKTRWMIPLIHMNMVVMNLMIPVLLLDPLTFLAQIGSGRWWYSSFFF